MIETINITQFKVVCTRDCEHKMQTNVYQNIVNFFCTFPQDKVYLVTGELSEVQELFRDTYDIYAKFGIHRDSSIGNNQIISEEKEHILFITSYDSIEDEITDFIEQYGINPNFAAILCDEVGPCMQIVKEQFETCTIMNYREPTENYGEPECRNSVFEYVDVSYLFEKYYVESYDLQSEVQGLLTILQEIKNIPHTHMTVFCADHLPDRKQKEAYVRIASILTFDGINFDISRDWQSRFLRMQTDSVSPEYMVACDYLRKLAKPISLAMYNGENMMYMCILKPTYLVNNWEADFELALQEIVLDEDLTLRTRDVKNVLCNYSDLEVLDIIDAFHLDAELNLALDGHKQLSRLLTEFEEIINLNYQMRNDTTLNFTNTLMYRRDGQLYLGFLTRLPEVRYEYDLIPLCGRYRVFKQEFTRVDYDRLIDLNIFAERAILMKKVDKHYYNVEGRLHFEKPRFINGSVLQCFPPSKALLKDTCGLSFSEVGMWSIQTVQGRLQALTYLLERFKRVDLHQARFLTYFGGCHPMDTTEIIVSHKIWRNTNE